MKRTSARHGSAFGIAIFVFSLIVLLIVAALAIKVFLLIQHSSFDGKHQYSIVLEEPHELRFFVLNPDDSSVRILLVKGNAPASLQLGLGVPVDGVLMSNTDIASISDLGRALLFSRSSLKASTTIVDGVNIFLFLHTLDTTKTLTKEVALSDNPVRQDKIFSAIFLDRSIYKEGESIAIVNGTGVAGLGNKVAQLFAHMGANVVSITTADTPTPTSSISYIGSLSYTAERVSHLLHLPLVHLSTATISDITVTLGTDFKN